MFGILSLAVRTQEWLDEYNEKHKKKRSRRGQSSHKDTITIKTIKNEIFADIDKIAGGTHLGGQEEVSLETVMAEFKLSNATLRRMMDHMSKNMDLGLEGGLDKSTIAMLPSFVPELPDGTEQGKFIAMDLGGTNLRVMIMEIEPGEEMKSMMFNTRIPNWAMNGTGEQLFDFIAKCLSDFLYEKGVQNDGLSVGFTFSYPCDQTSLRSAKLLRWTKGFRASGVVGKDIVVLLEEAISRLEKKINVEIVALINDTVGTMVAAAHQEGSACHIGAIIATGTNASYLENTSKIKHGLMRATESYDYPQMIIDTEWGGFGDGKEADYIMTQYDKVVDSMSEHPGVNTLDKLVAGKCMGELVRLVLVRLTDGGVLFAGEGSDLLYEPNSFPTKYISEILSDESGSYANTRQIMGELGIESFTFSDILLVREVCIVVSRRCANLGAAAIACVLNRVRQPNMVVGVDGSTYKYHPFFNFWVTEKLKELVDPDLKFKVLLTGDGSGKGAALIAAIIARLKKRKQLKEQKENKPDMIVLDEPQFEK